MIDKLQVSMEELMPIIKEQLAKGNTVRFSPRGTSMLPMLRQGRDSVLLSPLPKQLKKYDVVLYQRTGGAYVLHRIVAVGDTITCLGDNQLDLEWGLRQHQMIGLVTKFYRDGKEHSVEELPYRMYVVLWYQMRRGKRFIRRYMRKIKRIARTILR